MRGYSFDTGSGVWLHESSAKFPYSDGAELERRMLEILRDCDDPSCMSSQLRGQMVNWPTLYHFSPWRHNLLRHLKFGAGQAILELGAGCGAITRQLGESGAEVIAIEGSPARAACAAARVRDLKNVRVGSGNFQEFQTDQEFDLVALIGVLEYAPAYFKSNQPILDCLRLARSMLKSDGLLVMAIENQLGLKYFCGAAEDHTGHAFDGVQDFYKQNGPRTLGRGELARLLKEAGFSDARFEYPFPDYKLPRWVLTQKAFETPGFDPCAILRGIEPSHEGSATKLRADERRIWPVLHRNGLVPDLANSFLVLAGNAEKFSEEGLLAAGYAMERRDCFNTRTKIAVDASGKIGVRKSPLTDQAPPRGIGIEHVLVDEPYVPGEQLETQIVENLHTSGLDAAMQGLLRWMEFVLQNGVVEKNPRDVYESLLKPDFFDCQPRNLIVGGDGLVQIDVEWRYTGKLPLRFHALRYLSLLARREETAFRAIFGKGRIAMQLAEKMGISVTVAQYKEYRHWQHTLNHWIVGEKPRKRRGFLKKLWARG
jgi:hypothetical protein